MPVYRLLVGERQAQAANARYEQRGDRKKATPGNGRVGYEEPGHTRSCTGTKTETPKEGVDAYLEAERGRGIQDSTLKSFRKFLCGNPKRNPKRKYSPTLVEYAMEYELIYLKDFTPEHVNKFRNSWRVKGHAMEVQSERLKQFFKQCYELGFPSNPAANLKRPIIKREDKIPVVAFCKKEQEALIEAVADDDFLLTFTLTLKYTGLAMVDAMHLGPNKLHGDRIITRRKKTDKRVVVKLPPELVQRFNQLPVQAGGYWFWNRIKGDSKHESATGNMRRLLRPYFERAKVYLTDEDGNILYRKDEGGNVILGKDGKPKPRLGHPHQWRHTFVHLLIMEGGDLTSIAAAIGDTVATVTKTYSHWIQERDKLVDQCVEKGWDQEELTRYSLCPKIVSTPKSA